MPVPFTTTCPPPSAKSGTGGYQLARLVPNGNIYAGRGIAHLKGYNMGLELFESMCGMEKVQPP